MSPSDDLRHDRRWRWLVLLGLAFAAHQAILGWRERHAIFINTSQSLPNWAFLLSRDGSPKLGDTIFFLPPPSPILAAHFGRHPAPFGKKVLGEPGEIVRHVGRLVTVNHRVVGRTKPWTRLGLPLARGPQGVIPPGCYYVGSDHPDGFDSRYAAIGFVCRRQLLGVGTAVL